MKVQPCPMCRLKMREWSAIWKTHRRSAGPWGVIGCCALQFALSYRDWCNHSGTITRQRGASMAASPNPQ